MIPEELRDRLPRLIDLGIVERASKGRFLLSRRFYAATGKKGVYTRTKGLDRGTRKALLLKHISENKAEGSKLDDMYQVLPGHTRSQVQVLLREMRQEGKIHVVGRTRAGKWYPG